MACRRAKILAATLALGFGLEISLAPGVMPGGVSEAFAFGHGGFGGGGHFGGGGRSFRRRRSLRGGRSFRWVPRRPFRRHAFRQALRWQSLRGQALQRETFRWQALRRRTFRWTAFRRRPLWRRPFWARKLGRTPVRRRWRLRRPGRFRPQWVRWPRIWPVQRRPRLRRPRVQSQRLRQHGGMERLGQQLLGCRLERLGERMGLLGRPGFLALLFRRRPNVRAFALYLLRPVLRLRVRLVC